MKKLILFLITPLFLASCSNSNEPQKYEHEGVHYQAFAATYETNGNKEYYYCSLHNEYSSEPLKNGHYVDTTEKPTNVPSQYIIPMLNPFDDKDEIIQKIFDFGVPKTFEIKNFPEVLSLYKDVTSRGVDNIESYISNYSRLLELVKFINETLTYFGEEDDFKVLGGGDIQTYSRLKNDEIYGQYYSFGTLEDATSGSISFDIGDNQIDLENINELFFYVYSPSRQGISYELKDQENTIFDGSVSKEWNLISFDINKVNTSNLNDLSIHFTDLGRVQGIEDFKISRLFVKGSLNSTSNY